MIIEQTVEIPPSRWLNIEVPHEVPTGPVILTWRTPAKPGAEVKKVPVFGCAKGQFRIADDFDDPLEPHILPSLNRCPKFTATHLIVY